MRPTALKNDDEAGPAAPPVPTARESADRALATWQGIAAVMTPIIGLRGVEALFRRSLQLTCVDQPLLTSLAGAEPGAKDFQALRAQLAAQSDLVAAAASQALLHHFQTLMDRLIGPSLAKQLLGSLLDNSSSGSAAEEISP